MCKEYGQTRLYEKNAETIALVTTIVVCPGAIAATVQTWRVGRAIVGSWLRYVSSHVDAVLGAKPTLVIFSMFLTDLIRCSVSRRGAA